MAKKIPTDAFDFYFGLGPGRAYQTVAEKYGVTKRAVTKHAAKHQWQARMRELEERARRSSADKAVETLEVMNARHIKALRVIQGKALEALKSMSLDSAMDAVRALDIGIRQERLVSGEPSDRTAISVEDAIKQEYQRWMVVGGDEDKEEPEDEDSDTTGASQ